MDQEELKMMILFKEWVKKRYPSMYMDDDYCELDYSDMVLFFFWVEDKIIYNKPLIKTNESNKI